MKTYNRLMRIRYNGKLFDIFSDDQHKKFFLEVRIVDDVEKYFYLNIRDYIYLNKIYNINDQILYDQNNDDTNEKQKLTFKDKVYIVLGSTYIALSSIVIAGGITNLFLDRDARFTYENTNYIAISETDELEKYYEDTITFADVRKTLAENKGISDDYRVYVDKFINLVEQKFPEINLRVFNENLKKLKFTTIDVKKWKHERVDGYINYSDSASEITLKSAYDSEERKNEVIVHELVHALKNTHISLNGVLIKVDYRNSEYGRAMEEAFTELVCQYLLSDDSYFDNMTCPYTSYGSYVVNLFQILKLVGDEYTIDDFFNNDVTKLEKVLEKYGLEDLIELYDIDLANSSNGIVVEDRSRIEELESKLISLRVQQELERGADITDIYQLAGVLDNADELSRIQEISGYIKQYKDYQYYITEKAEMINFNGLSDVFNPTYEFYYDNKLICTNALYNNNDGIWENNDLYVTQVIESGSLVYKVCRLQESKYIDIVSNNEVDIYGATFPLTQIIDVYRYDLNINLNVLLDSEFIHTKMSDLNTGFNKLVDLKNNGASDYEIYENAKQNFSNWLEIANQVLNMDSKNWTYRLTGECKMLVNKVPDVDKNGNEIIKEVQYTNPQIKIYYNNNLIYETNLHTKEDNKVINNDLYVIPTIEDYKIVYKLVRLVEQKYVDVLTNQEFDSLGTPLSLTNLLNEYAYDIEINLDTFLESNLLENKMLESNKKLFQSLNALRNLKSNGGSDYEIYESLKQSFPNNGMELANLFLSDKADDWDYRILGEADTIKFESVYVDETGKEVIKVGEFSNPKFKIYYNDQIIYQCNLYEKENGDIVSSFMYLAAVVENNQLTYKIVRYENGKYTDILTNDFVSPINCYSLVDVFESHFYDVEINLDNFLESDLVRFKTEWMTNDFEKTLNALRELKNNGASDYDIYKHAEQSYGYYAEAANLVLSETVRDKENWSYRLTDKADTIKYNSGGLGSFQSNEYEISNPSFKIYQNNEVIYEDTMYYLDEGKLNVSQQLFFGIIQDGFETKYRLLKNYTNGHYVDFLTGEDVDVMMVMNLTSIIGEANYNFEINLDTFMQSDIFLENFEIDAFGRGDSQRKQ